MRLPHLDQRIALGWGEAGLLAEALVWVLCQHLESPQPKPLGLVLAFGPLYRLQARLRGRHQLEQRHAGAPSRKPWHLSLRYEELAALMLVLDEAPAAGQAWGAIQRASLNLTRYLDFTRR